MSFLRGRRKTRIDWALSRVLNSIDDAEEQERNLHAEYTWKDLDIMSARYNALRVQAYDKAHALHDKWQERVRRDNDQEAQKET